MANPHPDFAELAAPCVALVQDRAIRFRGVGFRFAELRYAKSGDLLSGQGAQKAGGRLNVAGSFPVVYASLDPQTATAESFQNFSAFGFAPGSVRPRVIVGITISVGLMLDLGDAGIRRRLGLTLDALAQPWWPVQEAGGEARTQALGRAAHSAGFEAVRYPSARRKHGFNLGIFPGNLRAGSSVTVLDEGDLIKYLK